MRVFIVDDSAVVRERLAALLTEVPEVEIIGEAADALSACDGVQDLEPDAVILDINLQGPANGIDVLERIRKEGSTATVIVLTNYPYPQYRKRCLESGASFLFDKSTEFEKVTAVLAALAKDTTDA